MKANDMRALDSKGLQAKLDERGEKAAKSVLVRARRSIARVKTIMNEKSRGDA